MARVPYLNEEDLPEDYRQYLSRPITLFRGLANSPGALKVHHAFGEWIRWECKVDGRLRELVILLVGYLENSPYEWSHHIQIAQKFGVTEQDVDQLISYANGGAHDFTEAEVLALRATHEVTEAGKASAEVVEGLKAHFDNEELTDILVIASFYCYVVRVLASLEIDVEPEYLQYLERFPLKS